MLAAPTWPSGATRAGLGLFVEGYALHASRFGCAAGAFRRYQGWVGLGCGGLRPSRFGCAAGAFRRYQGWVRLWKA
jgi:hypothetical protein